MNAAALRFHCLCELQVVAYVCRRRQLQRRVRCCLLNVGYPRAKPSKGGDAKPPVRSADALDSGVAGRSGACGRATPAVILLPASFSAVALLPCVNAACADNPRNEQAKGGSNEKRFGFATWVARHAVVLLVAVSLAGCLEDDKEEEDPSQPTEQPTNEPPPPPPVNAAPEITGTPEPGVEAGKPYSFTPQASDADEDFLEFTIENKPTWATFSAETGALTGTPTDADVGDTADITISVTDGRDTRSVGPFKIKIKPRNQPPAANAPPTISGVPANAVTINQAYSFQPSASDPNNDTLRFVISNRPSWASFSTSTGRLSGTPAAANIGTYSNIVISVNDGQVSVALPAFSIQVRDIANQPPTISGTPAGSATTGVAYSFTPSASDADKQPADVFGCEQAGVGELQHVDAAA